MIGISLLIISVLYGFNLANTIYGGDAGDLISAIITNGFAHPPGYSLYIILGRIVNSLSFINLTPAGKVTLISTVSTLASLFILSAIIKAIFRTHFYRLSIVLIIFFVISLNYIIWLYAIVPEVFPLNTFIILCFFYLSLKYYQTRNNLYAYTLSFLLGLALSHHFTFLLVLPSVTYLFLKIKPKLKVLLPTIIICIVFLMAGLLPNLQMFIATKNHALVTWGNVTNIGSAISVLLRQGYGTFSAGAFITNLPEHRLLQLKNILLYTKNDFTYLGIVALFFSIVEYIRIKDKQMKLFLTAVFINLFFFGPFFFFYANFPLGTVFFFATLERFLHIFYFFLTIPLYLGIYSMFNLMQAIFDRSIQHPYLKKIAYLLAIGLFFIYPISQYIRSAKILGSLKNNRIAEYLGHDVMMNAFDKNAIIMLSGDTILFNTQYIYYSSYKQYQNKILIHPSKILTDFYLQSLKYNYSQLNLHVKDPHSLEEFITANKDKFAIYSNVKYPLTLLADYTWIPQGLLYKLAKSSEAKNDNNTQTLRKFWSLSSNSNLIARVTHNDPVLKNLFLTDVLRIYGIAHQNTAYYFLQNNYEDQALEHIQNAMTLQSDDPDNHFLKSKYFAAKMDCTNSEKEINIALNNSPDNLYIEELKHLGEACFTSKEDQTRIDTKVKQYEKNKTIRLQSF